MSFCRMRTLYDAVSSRLDHVGSTPSWISTGMHLRRVGGRTYVRQAWSELETTIWSSGRWNLWSLWWQARAQAGPPGRLHRGPAGPARRPPVDDGVLCARGEPVAHDRKAEDRLGHHLAVADGDVRGHVLPDVDLVFAPPVVLACRGGAPRNECRRHRRTPTRQAEFGWCHQTISRRRQQGATAAAHAALLTPAWPHPRDETRRFQHRLPPALTRQVLQALPYSAAVLWVVLLRAALEEGEVFALARGCAQHGAGQVLLRAVHDGQDQVLHSKEGEGTEVPLLSMWAAQEPHGDQATLPLGRGTALHSLTDYDETPRYK
jgi:hypothetical protein